MDAAEMRQEAVANGEVQGNFGAPPPAPDTVVGSDDKSRLNAWCARFRDKAAGYNLAKQKQVLEKCYAQDCEQSLEGGNTNRPDRPGCRYVDGNGFCYAMGAGQIWCRDNAIRSCLGRRRCADFVMCRCARVPQLHAASLCMAACAQFCGNTACSPCLLSRRPLPACSNQPNTGVAHPAHPPFPPA